MFTRLMPDFLFDTFDDVTADFLKEKGIRFLLVDIDNTLAPYEEPTPSDRVIAWVGTMRENGVKIVLVSNNQKERVERFNRELGLEAFFDCRKPLKKRLKLIVKETGVVLSEAAALGDQIYTDVWGARSLGIRAILVPPIRDKKSLFFRFKRWLETPILKKYHKLHAKGDQ